MAFTPMLSPGKPHADDFRNHTLKVGSCLCLSVFGCSAALLAALSKNPSGGYDYNTSFVPFLAEVMKLMMSLWLLSWEMVSAVSEKAIVFDAKSSGKYLLLSIMYAVQNNLLFVTIREVDPASFQVLVNLKIPVTAALLYTIIKKEFSTQQVCALGLLSFASMLSKVHIDLQGGVMGFNLSMYGVLLLGCMIALSSTAGVFNEVMLKTGKHGSMHWQNTQLYFFGCVFTFVNMAWHTEQSLLGSIFAGFNMFTWLSILNMAFLGLITSAVLKYADNILRAFATAASMFLSTFISWYFLGVAVPVAFFFGSTLAAFAILMYIGFFQLPCIGS